MKRRVFIFQPMWRCIAILLPLCLCQVVEARYIGGQPPIPGGSPIIIPWGWPLPFSWGPPQIAAGGYPSMWLGSDTTSALSLSEGNVSDTVAIAKVKSFNGPTLDLSLTYNSYDADGTLATIDTVVGYGWTHSYNVYLFSQLGSMFRYDGDGRVTRYALGSGGSFTTAPGYFEKLVKNPDGSFTLTKKDKTVYTFKSIPGTLFSVGGPVWRLISIVDRNGNATTLTYAAGNLVSVTDTYGRSLTFAYNAQGHVTSVIDSAGRFTKFQYDISGHSLTTVTDPLGNSEHYSYDTSYQLIGKIDKAGRLFNYAYTSGLPVAVDDSANTGPMALSNSSNWATNATQLAQSQLRSYTPSITTNTDGRGKVWKYQYDANGYIAQMTAPDGATTSYSYDPATLQLAMTTDANGHTTNHTYDAMGNILSKTDALSNTTTYVYEPSFNMMTMTTDPRGRVTAYTIDPTNGNRTRETDPLGDVRNWTYDPHGNVLTDTDANGHAATYQYDAFGNQTMSTDALGNITTMTYDAVGNMVTRTDANGHTASLQYDGMNRLTKKTDPAGHFDQTVYDGEGNQIQTIDRNGHVTTNVYDIRQRLATTTDPLGRTDSYAYDGDDNRISWTDRNAHTTSYGYDVQNRKNMITDALGEATLTTYDPVGNVLTVTDSNGHSTTSVYDADNRRTSATDALGEQTQYRYDGGTFAGPVRGINCNQCGATPGSDLVTEQIDPDGSAGVHAGVTTMKYDALDRVIIKVRKTGCLGAGCPDTITANDAVTTDVYDAVGNRLNETEPDGNAKTYVFDADNREIQATNAAGDITLTTHDGVGNIRTVTTPDLNATTNAYDVVDRLATVSDSIGAVAGYTYDPVGNRVMSTDGNGRTTGYGYDADNRRVTETDPLGKTTSSAYDAVGSLVSVTDRNLNTTTYGYDPVNRKVGMTDALGNATQWQYDPVGNMIKLTDANLHVTQSAYDPVNRLAKETYADGLSRSYTYDPAGNQVTRTDQLGRTTTYSYNDLYFMVSRAYPVTGTDTFSYDLSGRMLTGQRGAWLVSFTYDGGNRLTNTTQNGRNIGYVYNIPGRTRQINYPSGRVITEHTDFRRRMDHINDATFSPAIVQYTYDLADNPTGRSYRNGATSAFTYNGNNWATNITHANPATFAQFGYGYDNEGNKQFEGKTPQDPSHSEGYQYDTTNRLIGFQVGTLSGSTIISPSTQTSYNLDPAGNWKSKTTNATPQSRAHNAVNELIQIDSTGLTYDLDGNSLNDGTYAYTHDEENRLTAITRIADSAVVGQYQYDAIGRRVQKIADPAGTATATAYYYDDTRVIEEQNSLAVTQATYVYGNYTDEILTTDLGGNTYYYHQNALWSVEAVTDSTAAPVERYAYDAYGLITVTDGTGAPVPPNAWGTPHSAVGNPFFFTGQRFDEEAGLNFYRARYYDGFKGRFLERDPAKDAGGVNLYEYVGDNPINRTDPTGMIVAPRGWPPLNMTIDFGPHVPPPFQPTIGAWVVPRIAAPLNSRMDFGTCFNGLGPGTCWGVTPAISAWTVPKNTPTCFGALFGQGPVPCGNFGSSFTPTVGPVLAIVPIGGTVVLGPGRLRYSDPACRSSSETLG